MLTGIESVTATADLLDRLQSEDTVIVAGGTDFVPLYNAGAIAATQALDISRVAELGRIEQGADAVTIGAGVRLVEAAGIESAALGAVSDGAALVGSTQTRARATIGGNICRASPSGDTLAGMLCCEATFVLSSLSGERVVDSRDFFVGPGRTVCRPDEVLPRIILPTTRTAVSAYVRSTVRNAMDLATVGVGVSLDHDGWNVTGARIAVSGAGPRPILIEGVDAVLVGRDVASCSAASADIDGLIQQQISPIDDSRGSAWYRRQLIAPVLGSVFARAAARAAG